MKVERPPDERTRKARPGRSVPKGRKVTKSSRPASFSDRLMESRTAKIREELDGLLLMIDKQAKEIEKSLTFESLRAYKELVRKFVQVVVKDLYRVDKKYSVGPTGKKKTHMLVKKVDDALDELTRDFLERQGNLLGFLDRLDQIRGMLLDMYS